MTKKRVASLLQVVKPHKQVEVPGADGLVDYEEVESLAREHRPRLIIAGYTAYPRLPNWAKFRQIADRHDHASIDHRARSDFVQLKHMWGITSFECGDRFVESVIVGTNVL